MAFLSPLFKIQHVCSVVRDSESAGQSSYTGKGVGCVLKWGTAPSSQASSSLHPLGSPTGKAQQIRLVSAGPNTLSN